MDPHDETHSTAAKRLSRARQRYTQGRRELVSILVRAGRPLTIPEIIGQGTDLSQSSVYRNLQVLEQVEVVRRVLTPHPGGARYELTEDLTAHHHHLVCSSCGGVADFHPSARLERAMESAVSEARESGGFNAEHHRLDLVGTCGDCS
jgi:Fur family transcriptional regulator, ferric uptake regulator